MLYAVPRQIEMIASRLICFSSSCITNVFFYSFNENDQRLEFDLQRDVLKLLRADIQTSIGLCTHMMSLSKRPLPPAPLGSPTA